MPSVDFDLPNYKGGGTPVKASPMAELQEAVAEYNKKNTTDKKGIFACICQMAQKLYNAFRNENPQQKAIKAQGKGLDELMGALKGLPEKQREHIFKNLEENYRIKEFSKTAVFYEARPLCNIDDIVGKIKAGGEKDKVDEFFQGFCSAPPKPIRHQDVGPGYIYNAADVFEAPPVNIKDMPPGDGKIHVV